MKREIVIMTSIVLLNFLFWLFITAGFYSIDMLITSTLSFVLYNIIMILLGDRILAAIVKTKSFNDTESLYNILNYSFNNYQQKSSAQQKHLKFYFFEYEKPIAFAFGNNSIFVSSSILQLRHSQQSQICTQAVAETYSLRGLANLEVVLGNPLIVGCFIFILIGKWLIYLQLLLIKALILIVIFMFEGILELSNRMVSRRSSTNPWKTILLMKSSSLFSVDKISDALYILAYGFITGLLNLLSFGQIAFVRQFDYSTDRLLSKVWSKDEIIDFLNSDFESFNAVQPELSTNRLKLLCKIISSHLDSALRIKRISEYHANQPEHRIRIHRLDESRSQRRIKIHTRNNGGHHEN